MRTHRWILALIGLLAVGLLATGCGGDDETTTTTDPAAAGLSESTDSTAMTDSTVTTDSSDSGASAEDVYNACVDALKGVTNESIAGGQCETVRAAFEQCAKSAAAGGDAGAEVGLQVCQQAADKAVDLMNTAGGN